MALLHSPRTLAAQSPSASSGMDVLRNRRHAGQGRSADVRPRGQRHVSRARFGAAVLQWSVPVLVLLAVLLRVAQYLANRSLWLDEASLALNVLNRGFSSLTGELDFNQGAPVGFLFAEKVLTILIGSS